MSPDHLELTQREPSEKGCLAITDEHQKFLAHSKDRTEYAFVKSTSEIEPRDILLKKVPESSGIEIICGPDAVEDKISLLNFIDLGPDSTPDFYRVSATILKNNEIVEDLGVRFYHELDEDSFEIPK